LNLASDQKNYPTGAISEEASAVLSKACWQYTRITWDLPLPFLDMVNQAKQNFEHSMENFMISS